MFRCYKHHCQLQNIRKTVRTVVAQSKIRHFVNRYCNDLDIKLVFTTFKLRNLFSENSVHV